MIFIEDDRGRDGTAAGPAEDTVADAPAAHVGAGLDHDPGEVVAESHRKLEPEHGGEGARFDDLPVHGVEARDGDTDAHLRCQ